MKPSAAAPELVACPPAAGPTEQPRGLVLVLPGGAARGTRPVDRRSLAWHRSSLFARRLAPVLAPEGIEVVLLRYRRKGWNAAPGGEPDPVSDLRWALGRLAADHDRPVALLGHSMGARAAVAGADHPAVHGVVGLAPWLPADESVEHLRSKVLRVAHGRRDRITSARATQVFARRAGRIADVGFVDMGPVGHYLLRRVEQWHRVAVEGVLDVLGPR